MLVQGRMIFALVSAVVLTAGVAQAKAQKTNQKPEVYAVDADQVAPAESADSAFLSDEDYTKLMKSAKADKQRGTASADIPRCEAQMPADFKALREELIGDGKQKKGVTSVEGLDALVKKYSDDKLFATLSPEAQFAALQLRSIAPYKSIVFRTKEYVSKYAAMRVVIVSMLRAQAAAINAVYPLSAADPVNKYDVVFKYFTSPSADMKGPVDNDAQLYQLASVLTHHANITTNELASFIKANPKGVWWDNRLYAPFANFTSDQDRCVHLGQPELFSLYSSAAMASSAMTATTAYSFQGLHEAIRDVGQLNGIDAGSWLSGAGPSGVTSMSRTQVLNKYPQLFSKVGDGDARMHVAFDFLVKSARAAQISFEQTKRLPEGQDNLFDPRAAFAVNRQAETSFAEINALLSGKDVESTVVNGDKVRIDIHAFYQNPPANLHELMPVAWVTGAEQAGAEAWGRKTMIRNYKYGMATTWNVAPFKATFPDLAASKDGKTTGDVPRYARILSQTWGASAFALPVSAIIF